MENDSVFGIEPEQLNELLSLGEDEPENSVVQEKSSDLMDAFVEQPGGWVGSYKLLSVLGEGGMGIVYLAEQTEPVKRQVALKVIKPGMDSKRVITRFEAEKQALALMQHPHIAGVYDAGLTLTGRPYFVMEYVKGTPITDYCDFHKLTIKDRLRLFQQICHAVQHAHQKGIIHRDIKPSNILVSMENEKAIPKIIDFGVAKATGKPLTEQTLATEDSQLLGTPEYMSPEQADMATEDIDTRSDVYSLGILLYMLLTGVLPFDPGKLRDSGIENIRRTIRQTDPKTPSTRLTKLGEEAEKIAQNRRTEISTLTRHLRKELEWIPLKAMRKERSERYRSASELADDIEYYLTGKPLIAGPPTSYYLVRKFLRRHAVLSAAVLAVVVTLSLGLAATMAMYLRAERQARISQNVSDFLVIDVLGAESFSDGQEFSPEYFLNSSADKLERKFGDEPLIEARIRIVLGKRYRDVGKPELAIEQLERAYKIYLQHLGPEDKVTIGTAKGLHHVYRENERYEDALQLVSKQLEISRRVYGETFNRVPLFMNNIVVLYMNLGMYKEAEKQIEKVLEHCERFESRFRDFAKHSAKMYRGQNYLAQGNYKKAEHVLQEVLPLFQKTEPFRSSAWTCERVLSEVYRAQGDYEKAQQLCETVYNTMRQEISNDHPETLRTMCSLGRILTDQGLFDRADELLKDALAGQLRRHGQKREDTLTSKHAIAVLLTKQGKTDEAETLFAEILEQRKRKLKGNHPSILWTLNDFGVLRREQKRYEEAESLLLEAVEGRCLKLGDTHPDTLESMNNLIALYEAWNKPEDAQQWRAKLPQTEATTE